MNEIREAMKVMAMRGMAKWTQMDHEGKVCVAGALSIAKCGQIYGDLDSPAWNMLHKVATEQYPDRAAASYQHPAINVNNHPETTLQDMLRIMDKAAVELDAVV